MSALADALLLDCAPPAQAAVTAAVTASPHTTGVRGGGAAAAVRRPLRRLVLSRNDIGCAGSAALKRVLSAPVAARLEALVLLCCCLRYACVCVSGEW